MSDYDEIWGVAEDNYGIITSARAEELGVSRQSMVAMERRGDLTRLAQGVYQVKHHAPGVNDVYAVGVAMVGADAYLRGASVENCVLCGNGGRGDQSTCSALSQTGGLVLNATITNNFCYFDYGDHPDKTVGAVVTGGKLMNALIARNRAENAPDNWTAGLRVAGGTVVNATVVDNEGAGLDGEQMIFTSGTLVNSIVEGKSTGTPSGKNPSSSSTLQKTM